MAGDSARELARRQREKAERLTRSAALWEQGAEGEEATAEALAQLPSETWTVFHDVRWPGRRYANVDHIVVGPPGVFVVDSKNWSGRVAIADGVLRQNGRKRERDVAASAEAGLAVAGLVPLLEPHLVHPVLCFVTDDAISGWARDVMVCSTPNVVQMLTSRPHVLPSDQVAQLCLDLDVGLRDAGLPAPAASPAATRKGTPRRSRTRSSRSDLAKAVAGLGVAAVLFIRPEVVTGLADEVSGLFFEDTSETPNQQPKRQLPKKPVNRDRGADQVRK